MSPGNPLSRPVAAGEKAQTLPHHELCRRRALPGTPADWSQMWLPANPPFGQCSRLQDEHLEDAALECQEVGAAPSVRGRGDIASP